MRKRFLFENNSTGYMCNFKKTVGNKELCILFHSHSYYTHTNRIYLTVQNF